jgi:hypothetical protein
MQEEAASAVRVEQPSLDMFRAGKKMKAAVFPVQPLPSTRQHETCRRTPLQRKGNVWLGIRRFRFCWLRMAIPWPSEMAIKCSTLPIVSQAGCQPSFSFQRQPTETSHPGELLVLHIWTAALQASSAILNRPV